MAKFKELNLKQNFDMKTVKINGIDISVKQYLPAEDKNSILENAMQVADQGTILNTFNLDAIFHVYLVLKYSDIEFTNDDKEDLLVLYDILDSSGALNIIISAIPEDEYKELRENLLYMVDRYQEYRNSARALVEQLTMFAPVAAEKVKEISKDIDVDKLQNIVKLANASGMQ